MKDVTIIANGDFPTRRELLEGLRAAERVVCCDGAFEKYLNWPVEGQRPPVAVVGDGDSLSPEVMRQARDEGVAFVFYHVEEQEMNDLTKAVRHVMAEGQPARVDILGATGLREDHTLGNISLLAYYATQYPEVSFRMRTDYGDFLPVLGKAEIASRRGQQVSLFSLTPETPVSVTGLKWPIENRCLTQWWQGTLNEALGDSFGVAGGTVIVYLVH